MTPITETEERAFALPEASLERLFTPAVVVDLDRVRANVARMLAYVDGDPSRWRVHLKTTKMTVVWRELLHAGVRRFKCATTREAVVLLDLLEVLSVTDADLLVAYPLLGPGLKHVRELAERFPGVRVSTLTETAEHAAGVPPNLGVFIDVNPLMNRTGVPMDAIDRIESIARAAGAAAGRFRGIHFYDGHIRTPGVEDRQAEAWALYRQLVRIIEHLRTNDIPVDEVISSGTRTFPAALAFQPLREVQVDHQVSPGTVVFSDMATEENAAELDFEPAAAVLSRVVSRPAPDIVTCDAGSKALAAEAGDPCARAIGWPDLEALKPSEEHLPMRARSGSLPSVGEVLRLVPRHVCPTVNLADEAIVIEAGHSPRIEPIEARGHDRPLVERSAAPGA